MFSTAPISHSRIRYPSSSDFSPMMRPAPPTWRKPVKDEPTETLVRNRYASSMILLRRVADNLFARQDVSVYASRALPGLLSELGSIELLVIRDPGKHRVTQTTEREGVCNVYEPHSRQMPSVVWRSVSTTTKAVKKHYFMAQAQSGCHTVHEHCFATSAGCVHKKWCRQCRD